MIRQPHSEIGSTDKERKRNEKECDDVFNGSLFCSAC